MQKLIFVMGATATGKSYFINQNYADQDVDILDIYEYQQKAYDEAGFGEMIPFEEQFRCLKRANDMHLYDIIKKLQQGRNVIAEQTFFKAKRRISYIDEIRKAVDVEIEVYVIQPGDEQWAENIAERKLGRSLQAYKEQAENDIEFPNPAEGFDAIYVVADDKITLRMDEPLSEILEQSRRELAEETKQIQREDEERRKKEELLQSMQTRPFWHYCEVCGTKAYITAKQAFNSGWDYPPNIGFFGLLGPRTCGKCALTDTLFWKVNNEKKVPLPVVIEGMLTEEEKIIWRRIKAEPESLLGEESEAKV